MNKDTSVRDKGRCSPPFVARIETPASDLAAPLPGNLDDVALVVPSVKVVRGEWNLLTFAYGHAARDSDALCRFYREHDELEREIRTHERHKREHNVPVVFSDGVVVAGRVLNLFMNDRFDGQKAYVTLLVGQCLTLVEGQAVDNAYIATASLGFVTPIPAFPKWRRGTMRNFTLAIPVKLGSAFGVHLFQWLSFRCEDVVRKHERAGFPPNSVSARLFDGGDFGFTLDTRIRRLHPQSESIPVVPAPVEDAIALSIKRAASNANDWDALERTAEILLRTGQPLGDALGDWTADLVSKRTRRLDGRKVAKSNANALRDRVVIEAINVLVRCGMTATRNDASDRADSACDAVAMAFADRGGDRRFQYDAVRTVWRNRANDVGKVIRR